QTTLTRMRAAATSKHLAACQELQARCSISRRRHGVSQALLRSLDRCTTRWPELAARVALMHPDEVYRQWLTAVTFRLEKTAAAQAGESVPEGAYPSARELAADVELLSQSLRQNGHEELADGGVQDWLDRIEVFGFHFARLDIREDARAVRQAVGEVLRLMGRCDDLAALDEHAKLAVLSEPIPSEAAGKLNLDALTGPSRDLVEVFRHLQDAGRDFGQAALGVTIASMTHHASDVLAMLWLQRLGAAICSWSQSEGHDQILLPVVPLFETIDDLRRAGPMMRDLLACPSYRAHVQRHGRLQMVMVGYSDSTKDGGYLSANWSLYQAQDQVTRIAERAGISVVFFHGRGGALGRGGGPAAQGILSLPPHSVQGRIRITEQGEVLAERYDDPEIALRHLEQMVWATLLVDVVGAKEPPAEWAVLLDDAASASYAAYRRLVEDPGFVWYFEQATPIAGIEGLPIASRPSRRRTQRTIADLRAIPYTFAWTQSRQVITAFYGLGTALEPLLPAKLDLLRQMYRQWPFFKAVIDNAELAVAKCEPTIAAEYAQLVEDRDASSRIHGLIQSELARTRAAVLAVTGHSQLLDAVPWLQQSIAVRNPYVAAMNLIQVELLRRRRALLAESLAGQDPPAAWPGLDRITELLRLSIQAVAAGVRTTG
ncbi:MAG: phosphoenolpyruvate carboxylase, partial [Phycisphaeraceae bacterium]|nr:phosphoenolpyruvate carboxylase [Phycisphaeraceae bacterium]